METVLYSISLLENSFFNTPEFPEQKIQLPFCPGWLLLDLTCLND